MLEVHYDGEKRTIFSTSSGLHSVAEVRAYVQALNGAAAGSRAHCGVVRLLIDATDSAVQRADVMDEVMKNPSVITQPGDRMAVVVGSMLAKLQATRNFRNDGEKAFVSFDEALTWLNAPGGGEAVPAARTARAG